MADDYPPYKLDFVRNDRPEDPEATAIAQGQNKTTEGPHSIILATSGPRIQIRLTRVTENPLVKPSLKLEISDLP